MRVNGKIAVIALAVAGIVGAYVMWKRKKTEVDALRRQMSLSEEERRSAVSKAMQLQAQARALESRVSSNEAERARLLKEADELNREVLRLKKRAESAEVEVARLVAAAKIRGVVLAPAAAP